MAADSGRSLKIKRSTDGGTTYNTFALVTSKSVNKTNEHPDITSDDDSGWRTLLIEPGNRTVDVSVSGVTTDDILLAAISAGTSSVALEDIQIEYESGATDEGTFVLSNLTRSGDTTDAGRFEAQLLSSGEITYTAAP